MSAPATTPDAERVGAQEALASLRAKAALAGWRMELLPDGAVELWRWSRFRRFHSLELAEVFLGEVEVRR